MAIDSIVKDKVSDVVYRNFSRHVNTAIDNKVNDISDKVSQSVGNKVDEMANKAIESLGDKIEHAVLSLFSIGLDIISVIFVAGIFFGIYCMAMKRKMIGGWNPLDFMFWNAVLYLIVKVFSMALLKI